VPQVERLSRAGSTVVVLGAAGRAGLLATYAASRSVGQGGFVIAVVRNETESEALKDRPRNVQVLMKDAKNTSELEAAIRAVTNGQYGDVVIDCTNVTGVEIGAAASCKNGGVVYFFNMATRFQAAALGAELVNRDIQYVIGYGLLPEAEEKALALLEAEPALKRKFELR
jgi:L-erythro-3,5-diaminohexanoate dehydrogenase